MLAHGYLPLSRIMALDKGWLSNPRLFHGELPEANDVASIVVKNALWCKSILMTQCRLTHASKWIVTQSVSSTSNSTLISGNKASSGIVVAFGVGGVLEESEGSRWSHQDLSFWPNNTLLPSSSLSPFLLLESPCSNMFYAFHHNFPDCHPHHHHQHYPILPSHAAGLPLPQNIFDLVSGQR